MFARRWTGHAHGRVQVEGLASQVQVLRSFRCGRGNRAALCRQVRQRDRDFVSRVILQLWWTAVALALTRSGSEVRRGLGCQSLEQEERQYRQRSVQSCCVRSNFLMKL